MIIKKNISQKKKHNRLKNNNEEKKISSQNIQLKKSSEKFDSVNYCFQKSNNLFLKNLPKTMRDE